GLRGAHDEGGRPRRARGTLALGGAPAGVSVWTKYLGVSLVTSDAARVAAQPALVRALTDGHDRAAAPAMPEDAESLGEWFEMREGGETVGVALVRRDCPKPGQ